MGTKYKNEFKIVTQLEPVFTIHRTFFFSVDGIYRATLNKVFIINYINYYELYYTYNNSYSNLYNYYF